MKMKKKLLMMLMAGIMAISVCACGGKKEDAANTTEEATTAVEGTEEAASAQETEEIRVSDREDFVELEDMELDEYVTIPDFSSMTVKAVKPDVTDDRIESYINAYILTTYAVTDRAVAAGDAVKIDYVGKKDGVAFDGGSAEGFVLNIGSGSLIEGFEDGLIGVMPGETVDLNLTFPTDYHAEELAGAEVVFTVTVHEIQESTDYASVTPEVLSLMGSTYTSKEEIWADATKSVEENAQVSYETNIKNAIMENLLTQGNVISLPEHLVDEQVQNNDIYMKNLCATYSGMDLETFVTSFFGMTLDDYNEQMKQMCEETVKQYLIVESVARTEGVEVTEEMINEKAIEVAEAYQYNSTEDLLNEVGRTTYRMYSLQDKVMEKLMEKVTVETISEEEAMAEEAAAAATETAVTAE